MGSAPSPLVCLTSRNRPIPTSPSMSSGWIEGLLMPCCSNPAQRMKGAKVPR
jgi:hypothetical protein